MARAQFVRLHKGSDGGPLDLAIEKVVYVTTNEHGATVVGVAFAGDIVVQEPVEDVHRGMGNQVAHLPLVKE